MKGPHDSASKQNHTNTPNFQKWESSIVFLTCWFNSKSIRITIHRSATQSYYSLSMHDISNKVEMLFDCVIFLSDIRFNLYWV